MSTRTQYEIMDPARQRVLAQFTLYGDHDADCEKALFILIQEALAIARASCGISEVVLRQKRIEA